MAQKKKGPPIGFGRAPFDADPSDEDQPQPPEQKPLEPPLAEPIAVDPVVMYEMFKRYNLYPLTPVSTFELQLVQVIGGLEKRIRELDPDL